MKYFVIIPCAGSGSRFDAQLPKQYHSLLGKTVLDWTLEAFFAVPAISQVLLVVNPDDPQIQIYQQRYPQLKVATVGGASRFESVRNGLATLECAADDWVLVHDAARCCVQPSDIERLINELAEHPNGGILAEKAVDTVKRVVKQINSPLEISETLNRDYIYLAQTPQMFRYAVLSAALANPQADNITDEASAVEQFGRSVQIVPNGNHNFKLTFSADLARAAAILLAQQGVNSDV